MTVSVEVPLVSEPELAAAMLVGLKVAVRPVGNPLALSATAELKVFCPVMVKVVLALLPWAMESVPELAASVNVAGATTVTVMVVDLVTPPPLPVTVKL